MREEYHKLVRDRFPEIIRQSGEHAEVVALNASDYQQALRQKLVEEAREAAMAIAGELVHGGRNRPMIKEEEKARENRHAETGKMY